MTRFDGAVCGFLLAALAVGVGWLAVLPPFEGFDETAHYSYVQELADAGTLPLLGTSRISRDVEAYQRLFPTRYADVPPFEKNRGVTYRAFFSSPASAEAPPSGPRRFAPGEEPNWQAQHPPLYYALLVPVYLLTRDWELASQMFALRLVSYLLALAGLALGALAAVRHGERSAFPAGSAPVAAAWPFLVPMFVPEMARIGNDSLCLLIMGAVWWQLLRMLERPRSRTDFFLLGLLLGFGLLTKVFFVPIAAGVVLFWACRRAWRGAFLVLAVALALGGPWYAHMSRTVGTATGSLEVQIVLQGGVLSALERFRAAALARGIAATIGTFAWVGTWSLARLPAITLVPVVALSVVPLAVSVARAARRGADPALRAALLLSACMGSVLFAHVLLRVAITGEGVGTPGWYQHVVAGPMGMALGVGLADVSRRKAGRVAVAVLAAYTLAYFALVSWIQLSMYAGCAAKMGDDKHYAFPEGIGCLWDVALIWKRDSVLAFPGAGVPLLYLGLVVAGCLLARLLRTDSSARAETG